MEEGKKEGKTKSEESAATHHGVAHHDDRGGKDELIRVDYSNLLFGLVAALIIVTAFNQYQISTLYSLFSANAGIAAGVQTQAGNAQDGSGSLQTSDVRPTGTPVIYGPELGVRYGDVSESNPALADQVIAKLAAYEDAQLSGADLQRYIKIGSAISCEYCCGAQSIIFSNGQRACGCAHSYAMRGLAKYLITKHGGEYSDDQILEELGKWKVLFFPGIHAQKAAVLKSQGIEVNYINLASNKYRGIEKGASSGGSMIGGC